MIQNWNLLRFRLGFIIFWCSFGTVSGQEIAIADPDFAVQGEYVGDQTGVQVIALGDGEFDVVVYEGGLPGAGARPSPRRIEADEDVVNGLIDSMKLARVDRVSPTMGRAAPAGATVLFDGTPESAAKHWENAKVTKEGFLKQGTTTKQTFRDYTLHLEFRTPFMPTASGQKRGNSGVYHQSRYETQILDSFGLKGLDNECGGIYTVSAPVANVCYPPMSWQTYDVDFTSARFDEQGNKTADARMTVRLNGVVVQNNVAVPNATRASKLAEGPEPGPIDLQDHGDEVRFRNIWLLPRDADREARRPIVSAFERLVGTKAMSTADAGDLLIQNLACNACHASAPSPMPTQHGPDLSSVFSRVRADAIVDMIANPHATKTGTTMPDPWPGLDDATRNERAVQIASYLHSFSDKPLIDRRASSKLAERGEKLYQTVGCAACHAADLSNPSPNSVPLGQPHRKYTLPSLTQFLKTCAQVRPGLRMPAMVGSDDEIAAVAAYLTREVTVDESAYAFVRRVYHGSWDQLPDFDSMQPKSTDKTNALTLDGIQRRNNFGVVFETELTVASDSKLTFHLMSDDGSALMIDGERLDNDGIHPEQTKTATYELKAGTYPLRVEYFDGGGGTALRLEVESETFPRDEVDVWVNGSEGGEALDLLPSEFVADVAMIEQGKVHFASAGCANCHALGAEPKVAFVEPLPLDQVDVTKGCLASRVSTPAVDYRLGATQASSIVASLQRLRAGKKPELTDARRIHMTMAALNCYACHVRDGIGGPELSRDLSFVSTVPEMGLEGRLPPSLGGVGDKLTTQTIAGVLDKGANERDYMLTRMPAFAYEPLREWHAAIARTDVDPAVEKADHAAAEAMVLSNGRQLCGNEGLACIKCHSFGGDKGGGLGAIDLLTMPKRLRYEWFQRYLQDPTKYRPGTRMPNSFVDGKSSITTIDDGDPVLQIDAMWQYLSQGADAKEPVGLKQDAILLQPNDEKPRIYRNFFTGVSARGIGVAFPNQVNLIWDAEQMSLARLWKNGFFDASMHWNGRGQGRQEPLGDAVITVEGVSAWAQLPAIDAAWPDETARDRGFRFGGYRFEEDGAMTFMIANDKLQIEETVSTSGDSGVSEVLRRIQVVVPASGPVKWVWQATDLPFESTGAGYRIDGRYEMQVHGVELQEIAVHGEAVLRANLPSGQTISIEQIIRW